MEGGLVGTDRGGIFLKSRNLNTPKNQYSLYIQEVGYICFEKIFTNNSQKKNKKFIILKLPFINALLFTSRILCYIPFIFVLVATHGVAADEKRDNDENKKRSEPGNNYYVQVGFQKSLTLLQHCRRNHFLIFAVFILRYAAKK